MTPMKPAYEIRNNEDGTLDEVVGDGAFHLEQMDDGLWWMRLDTKDGAAIVWLRARGKIRASAYIEPIHKEEMVNGSVLEYRNNWMSDEYYVDGRLIKNLEEVRIGDSAEVARVVAREVSVPYHDMGHTYSARSRHYFVVVEKFGITFEHDLNLIAPKAIIVAVKFEYAP